MDGGTRGRRALGPSAGLPLPQTVTDLWPKQIEARINQDREISRQLSLWNQRGSQVILGTLLVIPIKESLIYVQPL
jgi:uncharacterized membrane protein (UPF0182 family)